MATAAPSTRAPATMTARMVVMMTPDDKREIEARARSFEMTPSELMRRAGQNYAVETDERALSRLADVLEQSSAELRAQLSDVMTRVAERRTEIRRLRSTARNV